MRPEPSRWPPIERLLASLPADVPVGVLERKRLEIVLEAVAVPEEPEGFAAWVERDPARLARIVAAVVGAAASHAAVVRGCVAAWWEQERSRRAKGGWDGWEVGPHRSPGAPGGGRRRRRPWRVLVAGAVVLGLAVLAWWRPWELKEEPKEEPQGEVETDGVEAPDAVSPPEVKETSTPRTDVPNLEGKLVRVAVASVEVVPGAPSIPWSELAVVALSVVAFVALLRLEPPKSPLPAPPEHGPRPTRWGRIPPRGRPQRRILLDRGDRDALVWGIARETAERLTEEVDVPRSVDATIETGIPTLWLLPASEYRGVWIWRDTTLVEHTSLAQRLERELEGTLRDAGLPVYMARFEGVPSVLSMGHRTLAASALVGVGRPPRVLVLTDGVRLARRLADDDARERTEQLLRLLGRWEGLALVDFDGPRSELAVLARAWGLRRITPDRAAAHLAGEASRVEHPAAPRDLLRWEAACVVVPRSVDEDEAQGLRRALKLAASPFDIEALRQRADGARGRSRLEWSRRTRAEIFDRLERAHGYLGEWKEERGGARLLVQAIEHWSRVYDQAIAARPEADGSDTAAHLELERAMVKLWREPSAAAMELWKWWQTDALRGTVEELLSRYTDADGEHVDAEGRAVRVRLPWVLGSLPADVQPLLVRMGLAVRLRAVRVRWGGRRALGIGAVLGIGIGALGAGVVEAMRPQVEMVGKLPEGASAECKNVGWAGARVDCTVTSRHWVQTLTTGERGIAEGPVRVQVSWALEERPCEGAWGEGLWYVMCDGDGKLARLENGSFPTWSRAVIGSPGGRALAQRLLDSATVDLVVLVEEGSVVPAGVLGGDGQRLVIVGEEVEAEGGEDPGVVVVSIPEGSMPSLEFAGKKAVAEAWPEAVVVSGEGRGFEFVGRLTPRCPAGMVYIAGGMFEGQRIEPLCFDVTEVTVAAYEACVSGGRCSEADDGEYCNSGNPDRSGHPINCVDWEQAKAFCEASGARLPSSEEWEWAARGREEGRTYPWGNLAPTCESVVMSEGGRGCGEDRTWPVGSKPAGNSRDGVQDMAGNVWEWTSTEDGESRVVRGGSWINHDPEYFRASYRNFSHPSSRLNDVGFRCARTAGGTK